MSTRPPALFRDAASNPPERALSRALAGYWATVLFVGTVCIAAVLRLYHLDSQLWVDEVSALYSIRRPAWAILTEWPGAASHVFFELLAHWSVQLFGETPSAVRLPAALFGVLGVAAVYPLAKRILSRLHALLAMGFLAVSYHHIFYSQDARGYTALIFFFLLSSYLFLRFYEGSINILEIFLYVLSTVLACYSHPFGGFIPASHFLIFAVRYVHDRTVDREISFSYRAYALSILLVSGITTLLYTPFVSSMVDHAQMNASTAAEGPRLGLWLVIEVVEGLSAAFYGPVGLAVVTVVGLVGMARWWQQHSTSVVVLILPLILEGAVFVVLGFGIHPRYFAIALPVVFIAGTCGLVALLTWVVAKLPVRPIVRRASLSLLLGLVVLASAYPSLRYYTYPKQDFRGSLRFVQQRAAPGAVKIGIQSPGSILSGHYGADFVRVDSLRELKAYESKGKPIWVVTTLERTLKVSCPDLYEHIKRRYKHVKHFPGTVGDGTIHVYEQREK